MVSLSTERDVDLYRQGWRDGWKAAMGYAASTPHSIENLGESRFRYRPPFQDDPESEAYFMIGSHVNGESPMLDSPIQRAKHKRKHKKRKLSAWNKFVKANSNKKKYIYQSGAKKGKLNLAKMGVAYRKTPAGRKKK